jgi:hypothetical protein
MIDDIEKIRTIEYKLSWSWDWDFAYTGLLLIEVDSML